MNHNRRKNTQFIVGSPPLSTSPLDIENHNFFPVSPTSKLIQKIDLLHDKIDYLQKQFDRLHSDMDKNERINSLQTIVDRQKIEKIAVDFDIIKKLNQQQEELLSIMKKLEIT
jgi:hypothetical protein